MALPDENEADSHQEMGANEAEREQETLGLRGRLGPRGGGGEEKGQYKGQGEGLERGQG